MAEERGLTVDTERFKAKMREEREISEAAEAARKGSSGRNLNLEAEHTAFLASEGIVPTDTSLKYVWNNEQTSAIVSIFKGKELSK